MTTVVHGIDNAKQALKDLIPPMSVGVCGGVDNSTRLFGNYWPLWQQILKKPTGMAAKILQLKVYWHILTHWMQKAEPFTMGHSFICLDSDNVIEAAGSTLNLFFFSLPWGQIQKHALPPFIYKSSWFIIYGNKSITPEKAALGKAFALGSVGVLYDTNMIKGFIDVDQSKQYDEPLAENCTQNTTKTIRYMGTKFIDELLDSKILPMHIKDMADKGTDGWYEVCAWNGITEEFTF